MSPEPASTLQPARSPTLRTAPSSERIASPPARTAGIIGLGAALPQRRVANAEIGARLGVSAEWIERRTGISERRYAAPGQRVSDLATSAGRMALQDAGLDAADIDMVLVATLAADEITPSTAPIVAHELGAGSAAAIDVGAACAGAIAALAHATAWIEAGRAQNVLVIGAEILTRFVDFDDPRTAPLFADGAGALVVSADASGQIGPFVLGSDGAAAHAIRATRARGVLEMEGHETFLMAAHRLTTSTREVLELAGMSSRTWTCSSTTRPTRASSRRSPIGWSCHASAYSTRSPISATPARPACRSPWARRSAWERWRRERGWSWARSAPGWCGARRS